MKKSAAKRIRKAPRGQSSVEYVMMLAFGAIFALQVMKFFNDVFRDGLVGLERNVQRESASGQGYTGNPQP